MNVLILYDVVMYFLHARLSSFRKSNVKYIANTKLKDSQKQYLPIKWHTVWSWLSKCWNMLLIGANTWYIVHLTHMYPFVSGHRKLYCFSINYMGRTTWTCHAYRISSLPFMGHWTSESGTDNKREEQARNSGTIRVWIWNRQRSSTDLSTQNQR